MTTTNRCLTIFTDYKALRKNANKNERVGERERGNEENRSFILKIGICTMV